jgi:purine-binding chemotaxis protein CheW
VREVMRRCPVERVATAPRFTLGVAVIRGENVPVVDAGVLLTGQACGGDRFVVLRVAERRVALAVDEVVGARHVEAGELAGLPPLLSGAAELVRAMGVLDGRLLEVLESGRLIDAARAADDAEPREREQREPA